MASLKRPLNHTKTNFLLDLGLFSAIMLALAPQLTNLAIHEWLSLALVVAIAVHLLLHWMWLVTAFTRFFQRWPWEARLNLLLNLAFFVDFTALTLSGLLISREALPLLGFTLPGGRVWSGLHRLTADACVFILGLHVALHWKWLGNTLKRYVLNPLQALGRKFLPREVVPVQVEAEK